MKFTNKEVIEKFSKTLSENPVTPVGTGDPTVRKRLPMLAGSVLHFVFDPTKDLWAEYIRNEGTYRMVKAKNGELSVTQIVRQGNGIDLPGDTSDEALCAFFDEVISAGEKGVKLEIQDVRVSPSTVPGRAGSKVATLRRVQ